VRVQRLDGRHSGNAAERVRVAVRKAAAPKVGSFVEFKAHLSPPLPSLRPDGYDFARDMYFQQIGASGYTLGAIKTVALIPSLASRHPIKKWAAAWALAATTFYLRLSGAESRHAALYIMIGIVLIGIMVDWPTLTFRTLTVAALGVLLLAPESVVQFSFQMSFAATLALIAGYRHGLPWRADADSSIAARVTL
jgi:predicted membrane metal-binding protein